jgi:DNA polymerase-1
MPPNFRPPDNGDHIFLVDGSSYIFRAYFQSMNQDAKYNYRSDGVATGAVRMFCAMLLRLLTEMKPEERPTHLAVVFDKSEHTFRNELYPDYKAHRPDAPADLVPQFKLIREAVHAFDLPCLEQAGFEADDLIATYVRQACEAGASSTIVSSDKDLMQLVNDRVVMYDTMKDRRIGPAEVMEKFGVLPDKVIEVQALIGDSTDNVPGVPGIGPKTAAQLIGEYGDLETLLARVSEIKQQKRRETLIENAENARLSKILVTLDTKVPLDVPLADLAVHDLDARRLVAYLKAMEFSALVRRVADVYKVDAAEIEPDAALGAGAAAAVASGAAATAAALRQGELALGPTAPPAAKKPGAAAPAGGATPQALAESRVATAKATPFDRSRYETVRTVDELRAWVARAIDARVVAIDTETTSLDPMQAELCGFSLAVGANAACYVPLIHRQGGDGTGLFPGEVVAAQMTVAEALAVLKPLLEDKGVLKVGQNLKYDWQVLARHGIEIASFDDTMLMSYVLDAGRRAHGMDPMAEQWLGHRTIRYGEVAGTGKAKQRFENVSIEKATEYAAEDADVTLRLWQVLKARLPAEHMTRVYETLERPLIPVLARMERQGISIDRTMLARLSGEFAQEAMGLEEEIRQLAGEPLNPGSPKQLGDILFGKMGLADAVGAKKTKTGAWSTSASVLEDLAELGHALPQKILEWRQVAKLRSTYTDALPSYVNPETGRVHTNYALAATTTGRLSSSEPNLQNIPIRTEEGRKIRRAFIAAPGHKLVSADYSQIELRLLAEIADIAALKDAFRDGLDIHAMTASEMFGVPIAGMPGDVRRRAKAINFGIIYGISAFGLANQLGIPREEAGAYIRKYFERFPGIRAYMDATREFCRQNGYVTTIFGRKCHYPEIKASNPSIRSFNERAAINARLQGSAADIIRRAMIRIDDALAKERLAARMLLQVHDELIFEVPDSEVEPTLRLVKHVMEEAPKPAVALSVPLQVDARAADNWDEAH